MSAQCLQLCGELGFEHTLTPGSFAVKCLPLTLSESSSNFANASGSLDANRCWMTSVRWLCRLTPLAFACWKKACKQTRICEVGIVMHNPKACVSSSTGQADLGHFTLATKILGLRR